MKLAAAVMINPNILPSDVGLVAALAWRYSFFKLFDFDFENGRIVVHGISFQGPI